MVTVIVMIIVQLYFWFFVVHTCMFCTLEEPRDLGGGGTHGIRALINTPYQTKQIRESESDHQS